MTFTAGILNKRITLQKRDTAEKGKFGYNSAGITYHDSVSVWANVTYNKGTQSLREGALDSYDTIMIRAHYHPDFDRLCRLRIDGKIYKIASFNSDKQENKMQITATEITNP